MVVPGPIRQSWTSRTLSFQSTASQQYLRGEPIKSLKFSNQYTCPQALAKLAIRRTAGSMAKGLQRVSCASSINGQDDEE